MKSILNAIFGQNIDKKVKHNYLELIAISKILKFKEFYKKYIGVLLKIILNNSLKIWVKSKQTS